MRLEYPADQLALLSLWAGADVSHWTAVAGRVRSPGVIVAGGFDTGPAGVGDCVQLLHLTFDVVAPTRGCGVIVTALTDDLAGAVVEYTGEPTEMLRLGIASVAGDPMGVRYTVPAGIGGRVRVAVYDRTGALVRVLVDGVCRPGTHTVQWDGREDDGRSAPPGVYLCRLQAGGAAASQPIARR
jgi:hypothetical protein